MNLNVYRNGAMPWDLFPEEYEKFHKVRNKFSKGDIGKNAFIKVFVPFMTKWLSLICQPEKTGIVKIKATQIHNGDREYKAYDKNHRIIKLDSFPKTGNTTWHKTLDDTFHDSFFELMYQSWEAFRGYDSWINVEFDLKPIDFDVTPYIANGEEED